NLRGKGADEREKEQPEDGGFDHAVQPVAAGNQPIAGPSSRRPSGSVKSPTRHDRKPQSSRRTQRKWLPLCALWSLWFILHADKVISPTVASGFPAVTFSPPR